jgi:hypothetical protein
MAGKNALALIFGKPKDGEKDAGNEPDDMAPEEGEGTDEEEINDVADAMFDAIKNDDKDAFRDALKQ